MKIKNLIEILEKYNPNANIIIQLGNERYNGNEIYFSYQSKAKDKKFNKKNTPLFCLEILPTCKNCLFNENKYCSVYCQETSKIKECYQFESK